MFNWLKTKRIKCNKTINTRAMKQIGFIVGTGRCGTTILASVLNAHSRITIPHELQFIIQRGLYEKYQSAELYRWRADDFIDFIKNRCPYNFDQFFDYVAYFKNLQYPQRDLCTLLTGLFDNMCYAAGKEVFIEQTPWHGQYLPTLKGLFTNMKVVHIIRDGRDVAISFARTPWWSKDIMANLNQWNHQINVIHAFCRDNPEICVELKYEDLVLHPKKELSRILHLFNLEFEETMLDPEYLIDYFPYFKGDVMSAQSDQFKKWGQEKRNVFFPESLYGWKKKQDNTFNGLPDKIKDTLNHFGYET